MSEASPATEGSEVERVLAVFVTEQHIKDLIRFSDTCDDGEGYCVPKIRMISMMKCGLVARTTRDIYMMTDFGHFILERTEAANEQGNSAAESRPTEPKAE